MFGGLHLSFRAHSLGCLPAIFIVLLCSLLVAPAAYGFWWLKYGHEWEKIQRFEALAAANADRDAREAAQRGDFRTIAVYRGLGESVVHPPSPDINQGKYYGCRSIRLFNDSPMGEEKRELNQAVVDYARRYNERIRKLRP
ncbi:MAG: hypothetical protein ACODAQ_00695 [Phycisphaeraceae bacterium]